MVILIYTKQKNKSVANKVKAVRKLTTKLNWQRHKNKSKYREWRRNKILISEKLKVMKCLELTIEVVLNLKIKVKVDYN